MLHHKLIAGEQPGTYLVTEPVTDEELLTIANQIARTHLATGEPVTNKHIARRALQTLLQNQDHEVFGALFLDNQHRILAYEELLLDTLDADTEHP